MSINLPGLLSTFDRSVVRPVENAVATEANQVESAVTHGLADLFEGVVARAGASLLGGIEHLFETGVERPFATGKDGFVAVDTSGQVTGGQAAGVRVGDLDFPRSPLDALLGILSGGESRPVTFTLPGGKTVTTQTDSNGRQSLPLSELSGAPLTQGVDPKTGGLVKVGVSTPDGTGDHANLLVLPKNYDGPIFVCDIDDTLRDTSYVDLAEGKTQPPIPGAKALLESVAAKGIPIVYLSAGPDRIHPENEAFLKQLPPGVLLDRADLSLADVVPFNGYQAHRQADYKAKVLAELEQTYPQAKLFGLGDDKYGDAIAYTEQGVTDYIHDVRPGDDNLPADFHGVLTKTYDQAFIDRVDGDLQKALAQSASFGGTPAPADELATLSKELDKLSGAKATSGNVFQPYIDGENAFPQVLSALDSAKTSICYETFEFHDDTTGNQVVDHLIAAAKRGVKVNVLVDAVGAHELPLMSNHAVDRLKAAGIEVRVYNPIDRLSDLYDFHRDHRKTIVVDGATGFVGGMNTGDQYFGPPSVPGRLHDVFGKLTGPAVQGLAQDFADSWIADGGAPLPESIANPPAAPPDPNGVKLRVVAHTPDDENIRATYLAMIDNAKTEINVENDYPMSQDIEEALCAAAQRGVNVRYIVGTESGLIADDAEARYQTLLDAGVHIYKYPTPIHTKSLSVDGLMACVGSSNVDNVSLYRNREITAVVEDPAWVKAYDARMFDRDVVGTADGRKTLELPKRLDEPWFQRIFEQLLAAIWPDSME